MTDGIGVVLCSSIYINDVVTLFRGVWFRIMQRGHAGASSKKKRLRQTSLDFFQFGSNTKRPKSSDSRELDNAGTVGSVVIVLTE